MAIDLDNELAHTDMSTNGPAPDMSKREDPMADEMLETILIEQRVIKQQLKTISESLGKLILLEDRQSRLQEDNGNLWKELSSLGSDVHAIELAAAKLDGKNTIQSALSLKLFSFAISITAIVLGGLLLRTYT